MNPDLKEASFFKQHIFPVFFIFLIPCFSVWFFHYAETRTDQQVLRGIEASVQGNGKLSKEEKAETLAFYRAVGISRIMASSRAEVAPAQAMFESLRLRYATFRWMKRIAWTCLGTIAATFLIVGLSVAFSFRSQASQYYSLRIGWPVLRTSAAVQVLGQAVLAVALSFWVTAIVTESYFIKLIVIIGCLALVAVATLLKAIFTKVQERCEVAGEMVLESDAPGLWLRVREMAGKLETAPPDRIILGIEPSFFVTEHEILLEGHVHGGRTLYLSLPMLKVLSVEEADAVLGHELAHFSGQDTFWSRKVSPLTGKFAVYLGALSDGASLAVAHFMLFFWKLYGLSIKRLSRAREFRADQTGAQLVSNGAMMRALVKITSYCEYRAESELAILKKNRVDEELNLALHLEQGYPSFLSSFANRDKSIDERVPHPFDTHPTLSNRLEHLGFEVQAALRASEVQQPVRSSWYSAIATAAELEERFWNERQKALQSFQSENLAWRLPANDEEQAAIVLEHFPHALFHHKKNGTEASLDFDRIQLPTSKTPIFFNDIASVRIAEDWMKKRLILAHMPLGKTKPEAIIIHSGLFTGEKGDLFTVFAEYYSRHKTAEALCEQEAEHSTDS